ncbi:hypothetical protein GCK32_001876, partial [Trichostrongylus colubriformis]
AWWGGVAVYNISHCLGVPMDDIVWIRDDAPDDDSTPVPDQPPSENVPSTIAAQNANEEPETFIEIPVTFQPKSTEVRFYNNFNDDSSKNGEREGAVPVEVYQPFSTSNEHPTTNGSQLGPCGLVKLDPIAEELELKPHEVTEKTPERKDIPTKTYDRSVESAPQNAVTNGSSVPAAKPPYIIEDIHKTIEDINQLPPPPELPTGGLAKHVESVIIGEGVVKYVTGSLVLPNGTVLVTDEEEGIILFDTQGNIVNRIKNPAWRKPRSPIYYKEHVLHFQFVQISAIITVAGLSFSGPKWMRDVTVISERLSIAHTDYMYLSVCGEIRDEQPYPYERLQNKIFSALYELTPVGQWTELQYRLSESYTDMLAFAVIGPITQVLVVEGNKHYVLMFSVRDSEVVDRRRIAICERPGALARDEAGRLFVANRASAAIQLVDTVRWAAAKNVALADAIVPHFSASWGLLAIPLKGAIRLHRYSFRFGVNR